MHVILGQMDQQIKHPDNSQWQSWNYANYRSCPKLPFRQPSLICCRTLWEYKCIQKLHWKRTWEMQRRMATEEPNKNENKRCGTGTKGTSNSQETKNENAIHSYCYWCCSPHFILFYFLFVLFGGMYVFFLNLLFLGSYPF